MEPLRRWKRLGGVLEASHSALCRRPPPADEVGEVARSARPGASWRPWVWMPWVRGCW